MSTRLSTLDSSFLEVESPSAHMHVGWASVFRPPSEASRPTFSEVRDHIAGRLARAPRYRQRLAPVPLDVSDPVWIDDPDFDIDHHVHRTRAEEIGQATDAVMSEPLDRERPLWEMWVADRLRDGRIGVVGKAHHAMIDGLAAVEMASLVLDPTPEPAPPDEDQWRPAPAPEPSRLLADGVADRLGRAARLGMWPLTQARHPQAFAANAVRSVRALGDALRPATPDPELNQPISPRRHLARAHRALGDLKHVKRRFDATINDVVLAAAAGGVRRFLEQHGRKAPPLKAMVPVSMRAQRAHAELGNEISFVFLDLPCDEPDPRRRLQRIKARIGAYKREGRPEGADLMLRAFAYAPRIVQRTLAHLVAAPTTFNIVVSNIPGPREPMYLLGCELEEAYPVVPIADRHAVSIGMTTIQDEACFGIYADCEALPDADLLADCIDASVQELLAIADRRDSRRAHAARGSRTGPSIAPEHAEARRPG
jgi:diacylglycerol O-acyltransferase / wax synthase